MTVSSRGGFDSNVVGAAPSYALCICEFYDSDQQRKSMALDQPNDVGFVRSKKPQRGHHVVNDVNCADGRAHHLASNGLGKVCHFRQQRGKDERLFIRSNLATSSARHV